MLSNYVILKVYYGKENKNEAFLSQYPKVKGYPHIFILDDQGNLLVSQNTALLEEGETYSEDKLLAFLEKWKAKF